MGAAIVSLFLVGQATLPISTATRLRGDSLADHIADYVRKNYDPYVKNAAEFQLNARRDNQGRIGPVTMPNVLLGDMFGDANLPEGGVRPGAKQRVEVSIQIAVLDPTAGAEGAEGAEGPEGPEGGKLQKQKEATPDTSLGFIDVLVPVDVNADNTYIMNMEGINVQQAYDGDHKPIAMTELSSGAQDAPTSIVDKSEATEVVARLIIHVNTWRAEKCGGSVALPQLDAQDCSPMGGGSLFGWQLHAGPGHSSKIVAVACKSAGDNGFWVGNIDIPRTGTTDTALFGGSIPGPCRILSDSAPSSMLPMPPARDQTDKLRFSAYRPSNAFPLSKADKKRNEQVKMRLKGDRAAFMLRFEGAVQLGEASKFDSVAAKKTLSAAGPSFDLRKHDVSGVEGSSEACFRAPNRVRNQRDPASALACRQPATCILGGFTNFVSMIVSGIAKESCFPYKLRTDGATRFKADTGEMFLEGDVVPMCPAKAHGGNGMCPGAPGKEYLVEDIKDLGVYRIHNNVDATRLAILMGGSVTAAISWGGDTQSGNDFMNYGNGAKCGAENSVEGSCSNFDPKAGKDDPITLPGKSKLPKGSGGPGAIAGAITGVYDTKISEEFLPTKENKPPTGGSKGKGTSLLKGQEELGNPDIVLRRDFGVVHDHGGSFFFVKSLKAGIISEKQNDVFGTNPHVVLSLKWKLSKGGTCTLITFRKGPKEGEPIVCPVSEGTESFMSNIDMTGCILNVAESGMWTVGSCSKATGQCQLSHASDASTDHKIDSIAAEGHTGIDTEAGAQGNLQDKNIADVILANQQGVHDRFILRVVCAMGDGVHDVDASRIIQQEIEVDPQPGEESCDSRTLESMGNCKAPVYVTQRPVPDKAVAIPSTTSESDASGHVQSSDVRRITSPEESLRRAKENEILALDEARIETMQAQADEKEATREISAARARCPTNLIGVDPTLSDEEAQQAISALGLSNDEMAVLSEKKHGHDAAWEDCSWPEKFAMAKMFHDEYTQ
eukprot:g3136.t1